MLNRNFLELINTVVVPLKFLYAFVIAGWIWLPSSTIEIKPSRARYSSILYSASVIFIWHWIISNGAILCTQIVYKILKIRYSNILVTYRLYWEHFCSPSPQNIPIVNTNFLSYNRYDFLRRSFCYFLVLGILLQLNLNHNPDEKLNCLTARSSVKPASGTFVQSG